MDIIKWIDKNLVEIKDTLYFGKYFDSILPEEGTDVYYLLNPQLGIDLIIRVNHSIKAIHFYSGKQVGSGAFMDMLPFNIDFSFSQVDTRLRLGPPKLTGGGEHSLLYGIAPYWDKYIFEVFYLHLQFSEDFKSIDLITIGSVKDI